MNNTRTSSEDRYGIDIGRVIINPAAPDGGADTSFLSGGEDRAMQTPPAPDAFRVIRALVECSGGQVWLVSKCGARIEGRTRRWLARHRFYQETGMPADHLRFCLRRPEKRRHCAALGLTHFVDDRVDVLRHLRGLVPNLYLFGRQKPGFRVPSWARPVLDWRQVEQALDLVPEEVCHGS